MSLKVFHPKYLTYRMVFIYILLSNEFTSQSHIFQSRITNLQSTFCNWSFENIPAYLMHLILISFATIPKKVPNNLGNLSCDGLGARSREDWNMGRDERTALIKIDFPAFVNQWPPQDIIFDFILLNTSSQSEGGLGPKVNGRPKYLTLSRLSKPGNPKEPVIQRIVEWSTFQPYTTLFLC